MSAFFSGLIAHTSKPFVTSFAGDSAERREGAPRFRDPTGER